METPSLQVPWRYLWVLVSDQRGSLLVIPALPFCHIRLKVPKPLLAAYPKEVKTLRDHLKKKRLDGDLFQKDIARLFRVSEDTVRFWETNRTSPKLTYLPKVIDFLGYSSDMTDQAPVQKLKTYRRARGRTQKAFARILGVDPSTLGKWENGKGRPSEVIWERLKVVPK